MDTICKNPAVNHLPLAWFHLSLTPPLILETLGLIFYREANRGSREIKPLAYHNLDSKHTPVIRGPLCHILLTPR